MGGGVENIMNGFKSYYTPKDIAKQTGKSEKVIRARLRRRYPRTKAEHNTEWQLGYSQYQQEVSYWNSK